MLSFATVNCRMFHLIGPYQSCRVDLGMLPNEMMGIVHLAFDGEFAGPKKS